eukprot:scaffold10500_cov72-Isochrysis_galbana.AAC.1
MKACRSWGIPGGGWLSARGSCFTLRGGGSLRPLLENTGGRGVQSIRPQHTFDSCGAQPQQRGTCCLLGEWSVGPRGDLRSALVGPLGVGGALLGWQESFLFVDLD